MISDIKAKLPLKKKADDEELDDETENSEEADGDKTDPSMNAADKTGSTEINDLEEDEEVEDRPQTLVDKIKAKLIPKKKAAAEADDEEEEESGAKKTKKKKINPIVLVLVLGGLGVFLFLDEGQKTETADTADTAATSFKRPDRNLKKPVEKPADAPATTDTPTDTATTETSTTETPSEPVATPPADEPAVAETPTEEPAVDVPSDSTVSTEPTPAPTDEPAIEPTTDEPVMTDTPTDIAPESVDSVDGQISVDESDMTDKILEDLEKQVKKDQPKEVKKEYVAPPDYEYRGRGLVYNCAGKHWACVDAPSYKTCEDNFSSSTYQKKTIECYPFNVYETTKGCELMQNRVVSSNAKTGFCKGN